MQVQSVDNSKNAGRIVLEYPAWAESSKKVRKTPENFLEDQKTTRKRAAKNNVMR
jgi:hypothetical protein